MKNLPIKGNSVLLPKPPFVKDSHYCSEHGNSLFLEISLLKHDIYYK